MVIYVYLLVSTSIQTISILFQPILNDFELNLLRECCGKMQLAMINILFRGLHTFIFFL